MNIKDIAQKFVSLVNQGKEDQVYQDLYAKEPVSLEMPGGQFERCVGFEQMKEKGVWWEDNFEVHSATCSEPLVADSYFATTFTMDTTHKASGKRSTMTEVAVFRVLEGKIVQEQFFYDI